MNLLRSLVDSWWSVAQWLSVPFITLPRWQWLILAVVPPAIILLYFLKLKRTPLVVPSTYLWHKSIEDLHVNSIWQRLRRNLLLFLQLLLLLLAILALLKPSWRESQLLGDRFIFLLDTSASMQATDVGPSRFAEAKRRLGELIDEMDSGDVAMLISFADAARVEQTFTDDRRRLRRALARIQCTPRRTDLRDALKVASGLVNPSMVGEDFQLTEDMEADLYIFSDGKFSEVSGFMLGALDPVFVPVGSPEAKNVGIIAFTAGRHESNPDQLQVYARLENFSTAEIAVSVELYLDDLASDADELLIDADELTIPAEGSKGVAFDVGAVESGTLRLKVLSDDHLAVDDEAYAVISPPRRARVLVVSPGNDPLEFALETQRSLRIADVELRTPGFLKSKAYAAAAKQGLYDLVIYDRCAPERMPQAHTLSIGTLPPGGVWKAADKADVPQIIDVDAAHPLMQWIDMGNVMLVEATPLEVPAGGSALIHADVGPVGAIAPREGFEDVVLGFKLVDEVDHGGGPALYNFTNWHFQQSFPVFVFNLFDYLGSRGDVTADSGVRPGQPVALKGPHAEARFRVRLPDGTTTPKMRGDKAGKFSFTGTTHLGVYQVEADGKPFHRFAVNLFSPAESDIRLAAQPKFDIGPFTVTGQTTWEPARKEIWRLLLLMGLAVLLLEWYIYNRRVSL